MNTYITAMIVVDNYNVFNKATHEVEDLGNFVITNGDTFFQIDFGGLNDFSRRTVLTSLYRNDVLSVVEYKNLCNDFSIAVLQIIHGG